MGLIEKLTIYEQYLDTNIEELINGDLEIVNKTIGDAIEKMQSQVLNLKTAEGDALDMWGRLLNFSRYIPISTDDEISYFKEFQFYDANFYELEFKNSTDIAYAKLDDSSYRSILTLLFQSQNKSPDMASVSELAKSVFNSDIKIMDMFNMEFRVLYTGEIPKWLEFVINKYDILPRPACVKQAINTTDWLIFAFKQEAINTYEVVDFTIEYLRINGYSISENTFTLGVSDCFLLVGSPTQDSSTSLYVKAEASPLEFDSDKILDLLKDFYDSYPSGGNKTTTLTSVSNHVANTNYSLRQYNTIISIGGTAEYSGGYKTRRTLSTSENIQFYNIQFTKSELQLSENQAKDSITFNKVFADDYEDFKTNFSGCYTFKDGEAIKGRFILQKTKDGEIDSSWDKKISAFYISQFLGDRDADDIV